MRKSVAFGCVVDQDQRFLHQAARLLLSLRWYGGRVAHAPFFLVALMELPARADAFFRRHGARIHRSTPFDEENPGNAHIPSNKLRLFELPELAAYDVFVLIDCDTVIVQDPYDYLAIDGIGVKLADAPTVTHEQLQQVLDILAIPRKPAPSYRYDLVDASTMGYFNAGVVAFSRDWLPSIASRWAEHARKLLKLTGKLHFNEFHILQAALAATLVDLEPPVAVLPAAMNFPVHFKPERYTDSYQHIDPIIIHYHGLSDGQGLIRELPLQRAWERARLFNQRVGDEMRKATQQSRAAAGRRFVRPSTVRPKVVVGSGWWSDDLPHDWAKGDELTTRVEFFTLWHRQITRYIAPQAIVVTDSCAPDKPDWQDFEGVTWIELDENYGHPNDIRVGKIETKYSGFTRSVVNGAMFALCCDADYYVYVEQDCLVRGEDFLRHAVAGSDAEIFLGERTHDGRGIGGRLAAPMYQQSCIVVRKSGLERFISGTLAGAETDGEMSPENKMARDLKPWDTLKVPYGRSRPVDFSRAHFYVQHLQKDELMQFLQAEDLHPDIVLNRSRGLYRL